MPAPVIDFSILPPNSVQHFHATDEFVDWVVAMSTGRIVFDIGAGLCRFAEAVIARGGHAIAVEPRATHETVARCHNFLIPLPVERVRMLERTDIDLMVIVCRPDHSGWVESLHNYIAYRDFLYVGLERNVDGDLNDMKRERVLLPFDVGADGEQVWLVKACSSDS